jgi:hypothetical protein
MIASNLVEIRLPKTFLYKLNNEKLTPQLTKDQRYDRLKRKRKFQTSGVRKIFLKLRQVVA